MNIHSILYIPQPKANAPIRLVCFPYAGGGASLFFPWLNLMPEKVEVAIIQLPGRGTRFSESPYESMDDIVECIYRALKELPSKELIFFGHSMGARIAYEITLRIYHRKEQLPVHFIASGSPAPCVRSKKPPCHNLPTEEFIKHLGTLNGTPKEVLSDPQLMELLLPALRADFKIAEGYLNTTRITIPTTITLFSGRLDDINTEELEPWFLLFQYNRDIVWFEGGHFFINENHSELISALKKEIMNCNSLDLI
ncbi:hypothetical protein CBP51_04990 [Cellvibrio mixtus]|uniref:Thioesterase domain-containing protein n=1 Tax=Cellvibrio mixtus TaxID=39650 RepID=A0A266Q967_9GAMM|nr:alpha/beta fold hydrolase [Cellvibrio mixtus]OZY86385.1 hypothetical protein CBP51_04990 [Cellvibrio mixtus]